MQILAIIPISIITLLLEGEKFKADTLGMLREASKPAPLVHQTPGKDTGGPTLAEVAPPVLLQPALSENRGASDWLSGPRPWSAGLSG